MHLTPFGVRQFIAALISFGVRRVPAPLWNILDCDTSRVAFKYFGLRQFIAALISHHVSCRFCIFPIASSPPTAFDFITLSCYFRSAVRLNAVKQVPLWLRQRKLPAHVNEEISFNIWDILKNMEEFRVYHSVIV